MKILVSGGTGYIGDPSGRTDARQMMTTEGEERDRAECVYIQLLHGLEECSDEDEY